MLLKASCLLSPVAPCSSITKSKKILFISARQSGKAEERGVSHWWVETKAGWWQGCEKLQMPKASGAAVGLSHPSAADHWGHRAVGWKWDGNGMEMGFYCYSLSMILASLQLSQPTAGTRHRGWENFPAFSLWEAVHYQIILSFCCGEGISESVVCWVHAVNIK